MSLDLLRAIEELPLRDVLVCGDLILDSYVAGAVTRISPEAPIQVLRHTEDYDRCGGMASVALNLTRLGARVRVVGVVGDDAEAEVLNELLGEANVGLDGLVVEAGRPTTVKTRFVARSNQTRHQILRVDRETNAEPGPATAEDLLAAVKNALPEVEMCVLSDYGKGVLSGELCHEIVELARAAGVKVVVDPKGTDFSRYRGATAVTPNRAEAGAATGIEIVTHEDAARAARELLASLNLDAVFITMDREGIFVMERDGSGCAIHTQPREVFDVTGAGDNVIAVLACALAGGAGPVTAAGLANVAGGIAVEQFGVVSVGWDDVAARIAAGSGGDAKLMEGANLVRLLDSARAGGRRIVFTNGCFDILHPGHVDLLRRARALGDLLVVGLNDDESVRRLKGESRPVNDLRARASVLGGLASIDYIVAFTEDTPEEVIQLARPDVLVKGEDWKDKGVVGREFVEGYGGEVVLLPLIEGHSTTSTIERINEGEGEG